MQLISRTSLLILKIFIYLFLERGEGKETGKETSLCKRETVAPHMPQPGTWPANQAYALNWELNWRPFILQAGAQSTEPHQPGLEHLYIAIPKLYIH